MIENSPVEFTLNLKQIRWEPLERKFTLLFNDDSCKYLSVDKKSWCFFFLNNYFKNRHQKTLKIYNPLFLIKGDYKK